MVYGMIIEIIFLTDMKISPFPLKEYHYYTFILSLEKVEMLLHMKEQDQRR